MRHWHKVHQGPTADLSQNSAHAISEDLGDEVGESFAGFGLEVPGYAGGIVGGGKVDFEDGGFVLQSEINETGGGMDHAGCAQREEQVGGVGSVGSGVEGGGIEVFTEPDDVGAFDAAASALGWVLGEGWAGFTGVNLAGYAAPYVDVAVQFKDVG